MKLDETIAAILSAPRPAEMGDDVVAILAEASPEQWAQWRHHPMTRLLFGYLASYRDQVTQTMLHEWRRGSLKLTTEDAARGRLEAVDEVIGLRFDAIDTFFGVERP